MVSWSTVPGSAEHGMCPLDFSCAIHQPAGCNSKEAVILIGKWSRRASGTQVHLHNKFGIFLGSFWDLFGI